jgi:uroporphyrin-III C-methyltransferase
LALVAIGVASYSAYSVHVLQQRPVTDSTDELSGQLADLARQQAQAQSRTTEIDARLFALTARMAEVGSVDNATLEALETRVNDTVAELSRKQSVPTQDWRLAEVEFLLRLGTQRILMEGDTRRAAALFRSADDIIRLSEDVTALALRTAIASDLAVLERVFVRLSVLMGQVQTLSRWQPRFIPTVPPPVEEDDTPATMAEQLLDVLSNLGSRLAGLVDYRRNDMGVTTILPPDEEYYLRQNLIMQLQAAQLGLLRSDQAIYSTALLEARTWTLKYFDPDLEETAAMIAAIDELAGVAIHSPIPEVTASLAEVTRLLSHMAQRVPQGSPEQ